MPPKKKTGRAAAEAAYAMLMKDHTALVGDVGESYDAYMAKLADAAAARQRYEEARTAAVRGGAVTNEQLDQMGYKKTAKLPTLPAKTPPEATGAANTTARRAQPEPRNNGAPPQPELASVGAGDTEDNQ